MKTTTELVEELKFLLPYNVPPEHRAEAMELLERYATDRVALNLLLAFYSYLPEAQEDSIVAIHQLAHKQGIFLLGARTRQECYLYLATVEAAEFLGPAREGIWEKEVRDFFGLGSREDTAKMFQDPKQMPHHGPAHLDPDLCPVCHAATGETHTFGCPVEICPWCGGQLTHCNCRFEQLGIEAMTTQSQIDRFRKILDQKGRVPFRPEDQNPAFPVTPADLGSPSST